MLPTYSNTSHAACTWHVDEAHAATVKLAAPSSTMVWYGMVWYGMVWYGMVWYGMVWYGTELLTSCNSQYNLHTSTAGK